MIEDLEIYKSALDYLPEGVTITDNDGFILYCNKAFCEQLGYHFLEILRKPIKTIIASNFHEKYEEFQINQAKNRDKEINFDKPLIAKSGQIIWFHIHSKNATIGSKQYTSTFYRNEIDHKRQKLLLQESTNRINEYSFLTSHKLRHPIANILGLIDLIDVENLANPENLHLIDYLKKTSIQLNEVVHELNSTLNSSRFTDELRIFPKPRYPNLVMVIDDDTINQFITKSIINRIDPNIKVLTFNRPLAAIDYFVGNNKLPDIILLDLNMVNMTEWDFMKELDGINKKIIPTYVLKNFIEVKDRSISKQFKSFKDFVEKPITTDKLDAIFHLFEL